MKNQAIISVEDTENIIEFSKFLAENEWEIISSGKTFQLLAENKIAVHEESCINSKETDDHFSSLIKKISNTTADTEKFNQTEKINLVCINVIPQLKRAIDLAEATSCAKSFDSKILILLEAAAKNYNNVIIACDPKDYTEIIVRLRTDSFSADYKLYLMAKALNMVAAYNSAIANSILHQTKLASYPQYLSLPYRKISLLSHGMNSQQSAALYAVSDELGVAGGLKKIQGKEPSYKTIANIDIALKSIFQFSKFLKNAHSVDSTTKDGTSFTTQFTPAAGNVFSVAVSYGAVVGAALASSASVSCSRTLSSANVDSGKTTFASSAVIDKETAEIIAKSGVLNVVAPSYTDEAKQILETETDMRIFVNSHESLYNFNFRSIDGGIILQQEDNVLFNKWKIVTDNRPSQKYIDSFSFGMLVTMATKHESVILINEMAAHGIYSGMLDKTNFLCEKTEGATVLACNASLPFSENIKRVIEDYNVAAIIQTGNSDEQFINFCNEKNIAMVFTEMTHISL